MTERAVSCRDLADRLSRFGAVEDAARGKGGHRLWTRRLPDGRMARVAIPFHGAGRDVPFGSSVPFGDDSDWRCRMG